MSDEPTLPLPAGAMPGAPPEVPGYRCERLLGRGGMGEVWQAQHLTLERNVALKVVRADLARDPAFAERFLREARALAKVAHPGVVAVHDAGQGGGHLYLAMELVTGGDLHHGMTTRSLDVAHSIALIIQVADALQAIHDAGLVHRDLKPDNILLDAQGRPRIADLGLARAQQGDDRMTATGMAMGTPAYMSPEQANGAPDIDGRSDVYSLAATLFALLAGRPPFSGPTPYATVAQVLNDTPPDLHAIKPGIPIGVAQVVSQALAKRPEQRPASARAFAEALRAAGNRPAPSTAAHRRFMSWPWAIVALVAAVVLTGVLISLRDVTPKPGERPAVRDWKPIEPPTTREAESPSSTAARRETPGETLRSMKHSLRGTVLDALSGEVADVHRAALKAIRRQGLSVTVDQADGSTVHLEAALADGEDLTIILTPMGSHSTQAAVQIGAFGDQVRARAVLGWIRDEL